MGKALERRKQSMQQLSDETATSRSRHRNYWSEWRDYGDECILTAGRRFIPASADDLSGALS